MRLSVRLFILFLGLNVISAKGAVSLDYYCEFYEQCRIAFADSARDFVATLPALEQSKAQVGNWKVPSPTDTHLLIDYFYLPARDKAEHLIVLTSGVHGIEGFAGSAVQNWFIHEVLPTLDRSNTGFLLIHGVNPYGFKNERRVTENNIDLNRNFDTDRKLFDFRNEGYEQLNNLLNPEGAVSDGLLSSPAFFLKTGTSLLHESMETLHEATLEGQYEYPKGISFGGKDFEPQKTILEPILLDLSKPYPEVLVLDLHTGYGNRGVLHLFSSPSDNRDAQSAARAILADYKVEQASQEDLSGDFSTYVARLLSSQGKLAVPMVLEYGTLNTLSFYGQVESLRRLVIENEWHWYGAKTWFSDKEVRYQFREMYFPSSSRWRQSVLDTSASEIPVFISRFVNRSH